MTIRSLQLGFTFFFLGLSSVVMAQSADKETYAKRELRYALNEDGSRYVKVTFLNQIWLRANQSNPGTTVFGYTKDHSYDIGLRRTRIQLFGQLSDRIFFYTQFGQNNLSYRSPRKQGLFFLDAVGEFKLAEEALSLGTGLTGWGGLSRYASPSIGSLLTLDAPLYQQATNDATDQFLRKLSIYAKGKLGKLDYRIALSNPMPIQTSNVQAATIGNNSLFSAEPAKAQWQGYFMFQFRDQESNLTPYNPGSYLGKKDIFNIGAGFIHQPDAMWHLSDNGSDTLRSAMSLFAVDLFYDHPLNSSKHTAVTLYASFSVNDYGKNYLRNVGAMNPANGNSDPTVLNGAGSAFPMIGSGTTAYLQAGYLFGDQLLGNLGTLQPFAASQISNFDLLEDVMLMYEAGLNWLIIDHAAKLSFMYQNRPVFRQQNNGAFSSTERRGMAVLQLQVGI